MDQSFHSGGISHALHEKHIANIDLTNFRWIFEDAIIVTSVANIWESSLDFVLVLVVSVSPKPKQIRSLSND